jgi:hypothetical protein
MPDMRAWRFPVAGLPCRPAPSHAVACRACQSRPPCHENENPGAWPGLQNQAMRGSFGFGFGFGKFRYFQRLSQTRI